MNEQIRELLAIIKEYLARLIPGVERMKEDAQFGKRCRLKEFEDLYEGLRWIFSGLASTREQHNINVDMDNIRNILEELLGAVEINDCVLIGDLLEYEILPALKRLESDIDSGC